MSPSHCPDCGKNLALVGRVHLCPAPTAASGGHTKVTYAHNGHGIVEIRQPVNAVIQDSADMANMANASTTYKHRDPDKRRAYQRDLMRKKRANKHAGGSPN